MRLRPTLRLPTNSTQSQCLPYLSVPSPADQAAIKEAEDRYLADSSNSAHTAEYGFTKALIEPVGLPMRSILLPRRCFPASSCFRERRRDERRGRGLAVAKRLGIIPDASVYRGWGHPCTWIPPSACTDRP